MKVNFYNGGYLIITRELNVLPEIEDRINIGKDFYHVIDRTFFIDKYQLENCAEVFIHLERIS